MKEVNYKDLGPADVEKYVNNEIKMTSLVKHEHIVQFTAYFDYQRLKKAYIVM